MKSRLYAVKDLDAELFSPPFTSYNDKMAERAVTQAMADPNLPISKFASHFALYVIGTWDDASGKITSNVDVVGLCSDIKERN